MRRAGGKSSDRGHLHIIQRDQQDLGKGTVVRDVLPKGCKQEQHNQKCDLERSCGSTGGYRLKV